LTPAVWTFAEARLSPDDSAHIDTALSYKPMQISLWGQKAIIM
jgi:hypothetical protein